ncbi:MAG: hypothetical protein AAB415_00950 [Patescibacteria group bacterium]
MIAYHPVKIPGRPKRFRAFGGLILLLAILLGLSRGSIRHLAADASLRILSPLWTIGRGARRVETDLGGVFSSKIHLANENAQLRNLVAEQRAALLAQAGLRQENITLRALVSRAPDPPPLTIGRVASRGAQFPLGLAIIDLGSLNEEVKGHLTAGAVVTVEGTVALGELTEIYSATAQMRLYSTTGERISGNLGENHIPIELTGRGAGNFVGLLPRDLPAAAGDEVTIVAAGHEFVIAVVSEIERAAGDSFQEIFLRSPVNISQLTWVEMYAP